MKDQATLPSLPFPTPSTGTASRIPRLLASVLCAACLGIGSLAASAADAARPALHPELEALRPFLGRTWSGEFKNSTPEKPVVDISRWERALNGQAVRILHSINRGSYGGETIVRWDAEKKALVYFYFTTAGFMTTGTMTISGQRYVAHEKVSGAADGTTEVRSSGELKPDGTMVTESEYLKGGQWVPGHGAVYREAPGAEVVFK